MVKEEVLKLMEVEFNTKNDFRQKFAALKAQKSDHSSHEQLIIENEMVKDEFLKLGVNFKVYDY